MAILDILKRKEAPVKLTRKYVQKRGYRGYNAADSKARYGDFRASRGSADYELRQALATIRAKSRYLARNSSSMKRFLGLLKVNVVGQNGIILQCRVRKQDGDLDQGLNKQVEREWKQWCKAPTIDGKMSMVDLQNQRISSLAMDGESIWEIVYNRAYKDGIAVNPIEADYLDETLNMINPLTGNQIRMGVEISALGRPVAYHFLTQHPGDLTWYSYDMKRRYRRVPAERVIHTYEHNRPGQTRGEPFMVTAINTIKMLDGYREAETTGRRLKSAIMGFFKRMAPGTTGIDELADSPGTSDDYEDSEGGNLLEMSVTPGLLKELEPGLEFQGFDPGGSMTDYAQFETKVKTDVAQGAMISVFSHGMETKEISYSAGRLIVTEDRDYYKTLQKFMIRTDLDPLFVMWLRMRMLQIESRIPPTRFEKITESIKFHPRGWEHIDPAKDIKANSLALADKQKSLTSVLAERGVDIEDHFDELVNEREMAEKRGLRLEYNGVNTENDDTSTVEDEDDDDKNDDET